MFEILGETLFFHWLWVLVVYNHVIVMGLKLEYHSYERNPVMCINVMYCEICCCLHVKYTVDKYTNT